MADIVVTEFMDAAGVEALAGFDVRYDPQLVDKPQELRAALADCRGLIVRNRTQVRAPLLEAAPRLKVVGRLGVGLENIDLAACAARGVPVFPATGTNDETVAEFVIGAAIMLLRAGAFHVTSEVLAGQWEKHSKFFYEHRVAEMKAKLAQHRDDLAAYDNLAVAYEKLGDQDSAISVMLARPAWYRARACVSLCRAAASCTGVFAATARAACTNAAATACWLDMVSRASSYSAVSARSDADAAVFRARRVEKSNRFGNTTWTPAAQFARSRPRPSTPPSRVPPALAPLPRANTLDWRYTRG